MRTRVVRVAVGLVLGLTGLIALADEGRTPIYQYPTVINQPGKYVVTRNISSGGAGLAPVIDVQAPNVDIDLNGFTLSDFPAGAHPVIHTFGGVPLTIRNGTLVGGNHGIYVQSGADDLLMFKVVIEDVNVLNSSARGIYVRWVSDFALRRNNVAFTGAEAIYIDGDPLLPSPVMGTIEHNRIVECGGGITVIDGSSVAFLNNRLENLDIVALPPSQGAIVYDYAEGGLIAGNTIEAVINGDGIFLGDTEGCKIYNNVVRRVDFNGIHVAGFSHDNLVLDNVVSRSGRDGCRVDGMRNHIERNTLNANGGSGIAPYWGLHISNFWGVGNDNTYGRNMARGNFGVPAACPWPGVGNPPTTDFCDEGFGNDSYFDNYMPNFF